MEQKWHFLLTTAYLATAAALVYLGLRYALVWLLPFVLALALAAWIEPYLQWVRRRMHLTRPFLAAVVTLITLTLVSALLSTLVSALWRQMTDLLGQAPQLLSALPTFLENITARLEEYRVHLPPATGAAAGEMLNTLGSSLGEAALALSTTLWEHLSKGIRHVPGLLLLCITQVLALFFTVSCYPHLRSFLLRQIPQEKRQQAQSLKEGTVDAVWKWLRSQLLLLTVTFFELLAGFLLLRRDYALLLSFLIALLDALPIFGAGLVLLPWAVVRALVGDMVGALGLAALYVVVWLVRSILEPKLLGKSGGLPPLLSLMAIYVGFRVAGIAGMLLGPLLMLLLKELHDRRLLQLWK